MRGGVLIAFYSWSGRTRKLAHLIHSRVDGELFEIEPVEPYPTSYSETLRRARREIREGLRPPLKSRLRTVEPYRLIFLGSPNWWGTVAPPVATFLTEYEFAGKAIAPFFTHGGGGLQGMLDAVKELCPNSIVLEPLVVRGSYVDRAGALVDQWLRRIGIDRFLE